MEFCKGSKDGIAARVLKFLMEPDESMCVDPAEDDEEEDDDEDLDEDEDEDEADEEEYNMANERHVRGGGGGGGSDDRRRSSKPSPRSGRAASGRPRRSTAGKSNGNYNFY